MESSSPPYRVAHRTGLHPHGPCANFRPMIKDAALFAAQGLARRREHVQARRDQVWILKFGHPGMSAEDVARALKVSPSTIRGDWRALARSKK